MLDELIKELEELKKYKHKYECCQKDKQTMSDRLYELMLEKYNNTPNQKRRIVHIEKNMLQM